MLADFAKRNFLVRPDEMEQPDVDRIEWILTDHDVKARAPPPPRVMKDTERYA